MLIISKDRVEVYDPEESLASLANISDAHQYDEGFYIGPDGEKYYVGVSQWRSHTRALEGVRNGSLLFGVAVDGRYRVVALGSNATHMEDLITSVDCIEEEDIREFQFEFELNTTEFSTNVSIDLNESMPERTASISNVESSIEYGEDNEATVHATISGESNNSAPVVELRGPGGEMVSREILSESALSDGTEDVELRLSSIGPPEAGEYTIEVYKGITADEPLHETPLTVTGPDIVIQDVSIQPESVPYTDTFRIESASFTLKNAGETPVKIQDITIDVSDSSGSTFVLESLEPGETQTISESASMNYIDLKPGRNTVRVVVASQNGVLAEKTVTVRTG